MVDRVRPRARARPRCAARSSRPPPPGRPASSSRSGHSPRAGSAMSRERDLLPVAPPPVLVFALWVARGVPRSAPWIAARRPRRRRSGTAPAGETVCRAGVGARRFQLHPALAPRARSNPHRRWSSSIRSPLPLLVGVAVFLPRRLRLVLPVTVALVLVSLSVLSTREIERLTLLDRAWVFDVGDPRWVDRAADGPVTFLQAGTALSAGFWKHAFWNRRIESVAYVLGRAALSSAGAPVVELPPSGLLRTAAGTGWPHAARRRRRPRSSSRASGSPRRRVRPTSTGLTLWRAEPPARRQHLAHRRAAERGHRRRGLDHRLPLRPRAARADAAREAGHAGRAAGERHDVARPGDRQPSAVWTGSVPTPPDADGQLESACSSWSAPACVGSTRLEFVRE